MASGCASEGAGADCRDSGGKRPRHWQTELSAHNSQGWRMWPASGRWDRGVPGRSSAKSGGEPPHAP
jgi:hypothetical protein